MLKDVLTAVLPQQLAQTEQGWTVRGGTEGGGPNGCRGAQYKMRIQGQKCGFRPKVRLAHDLCFDSCQQRISGEEQDKHVGLLARTLSKPLTSCILQTV